MYSLFLYSKISLLIGMIPVAVSFQPILKPDGYGWRTYLPGDHFYRIARNSFILTVVGLVKRPAFYYVMYQLEYLE